MLGQRRLDRSEVISHLAEVFSDFSEILFELGQIAGVPRHDRPARASSGQCPRGAAGVLIPVATAGHLVALKLLARDDETRPQDAADLRALHAVLGAADRGAARTAAELIVERGFARRRPLTALTEAFLGG